MIEKVTPTNRRWIPVGTLSACSVRGVYEKAREKEKRERERERERERKRIKRMNEIESDM